MSEKNITFEDLPKAMSWMMDKLNELDSKIDSLNNPSPNVPTEQWMNLKELCDYIPSHPAEQTVYGWTSCHLIPFHKRGKRIMFLKSEIDEWLHAGKIKSEKDLEDEAAQFIKSKRNVKVLMDATNLCNALRMEFEGVFESKIPLDAFPAKIQDMILALARQENYSIEYMMASLLVAVSTAIGNAVNIRIRGGWISNSALYMILVGRPGMGKTPPLDFAFRPIRKHDAKIIKQFKLDMEHYNSLVENGKAKKDNSSPLPDKPILRRTIISDFTPEALMRALDDNQRGIVVYVDEIMGMFNAVNQYSKGQLIEQLLTAFSGKPLDISRCSMPIPIHIEHPFINIVGTMQTTRMHELIEKGYKDNGLIDRIIFVYPSSQEISDWQLDEDSSSASFDKYSAMWESIINKVISLPFTETEDNGLTQKILDFSSEAKAFFTNWRNEAIRAVNQIQDDGLVDSRVIKAPMITARLALVLQILRWACDEVHKDFVDIDSAKSAIALSEYFENCYVNIQKYMLRESVEPQKRELLDCLSANFTTADALQAGKEVGLSERSVMYSLVNLATNKIIKKVKRGEYEKLQ